jgi:hypothetical protein
MAKGEDLEDIILSTLNEIESGEDSEKVEKRVEKKKVVEPKPALSEVEVFFPREDKFLDTQEEEILEETPEEKSFKVSESEKEFLSKILERTSVLFEGLKSPDITFPEKKLELTLKYLEYLNLEISERLENDS